MKKDQHNQHVNDSRQINDAPNQAPQLIPAVDILETEEMVTVHIEMPGINKDDVTINLADDALTISGSMLLETGETETFLLKEFETVNYIRRFNITETIDDRGIKASMSNGILTVKLPKIAPAPPRKIVIDAHQ